MKNKLKFLTVLALFSIGLVSAQTGVGTTTPDASSVLDVTSSTKGFLTPRMTTTERNSIASPAKGLIVYNTTLDCLQVNNGTPASPTWECIGDGKSLLNGTTDPIATTGANGDFYINTATNTIFGPKAGGVWPATGTSIVGPAGSNATADGDAWAVTGEDQTSAIGRTGNVGIGTTTPNAQLQLGNTVSNRKIVLFESSNNEHQFYGFGLNPGVLRYQSANATADHVFYSGIDATNSLELMRITGTGNVGVGTVAPTEKLDVAGSIKMVDGNQAAGKIMVSDASGKATWTSATTALSGTADLTSDLWTENAGATVVATGNVGIGTTTPNAELQLGNTASNRKLVLFEGSNNEHQFYGFGLNPGVLRYQSANATADHVFYSGIDATSSLELARIKGNGQLVLPKYGSGTNTGLITNFLGVDAYGNVVESNLSSGTAPNIYNVDGVINSGQNRNINMNGGSLNFQGTNGTFRFNNTGNTFTTNATNLIMEQTGDLIGKTSLILENRIGSNGLRLRQGSTDGTDVIDLRLETASTTSNLRSEGRNIFQFDSTAAAGDSELQLGIPGNPSFVIGDDYAIFRNMGAKGVYIDGMTNQSQNGSRLVNSGTTMFLDRRVASATPTDAAFAFRANTTDGSTQLMSVNYNGNVGIGTATPNAQLQLGNTASNRKVVLFEGSNNEHQFYGFGINPGVLRYQSANATADHVFYSGIDATNSLELMRITGTGNVGVGTVAPTEKLDVVGSIKMVDGNQAAGKIMVSDASGKATWTSATTALSGTADLTSDLWTENAGATVVATGNVGIGTTIPNAQLQLGNTASNRKVVLFESFNNEHQFYGFGLNPGVLRYQSANATADHVFYSGIDATNSLELMRITGAGNVGIGTTTPTEKLDVAGNTNIYSISNPNSIATARQLLIGESTNNAGYKLALGYLYDGAWKSSIQSTENGVSASLILNGNGGNVGIGTATPTAKLHVIGNVIATGGYADYVLEDYVDGTSTLNPSYTRKSLTEVEAFINNNKHLPGVTSIKDLKVATNGEYEIDITKLQVQLLEKIEELYLHTIEQQKQIDTLKTELKAIKIKE